MLLQEAAGGGLDRSKSTDFFLTGGGRYHPVTGVDHDGCGVGERGRGRRSQGQCPGHLLTIHVYHSSDCQVRKTTGTEWKELLFSGSVVSNSVSPWTAACQASLSFTISQSLLKFMSIESLMPSNHLTLCCPLLLLPSIFASVKVFNCIEGRCPAGKPRCDSCCCGNRGIWTFSCASGPLNTV